VACFQQTHSHLRFKIHVCQKNLITTYKKYRWPRNDIRPEGLPQCKDLQQAAAKLMPKASASSMQSHDSEMKDSNENYLAKTTGA
jgi:hypothetical protein